MGDSYRQNPAYDYPTTHAPYNPAQYAPPSSSDPYAGALTTRDTSYYPSQSNMQLSQSTRRPSSADYLDPNRPHSSRRHSHKSRSRSRHGRSSAAAADYDDDDGYSHARSRSRSKSRGAEWGATLAGAAAGGLLGHKAGRGDKLGTVGGIIAGAVGAHELERGYEKRKERKRLEDPYAYGEGGGATTRRRRRRSSGGGLFDGVREKVEGFLSPGGEGEREREREREGKRRARSHVEERRRRGGDGYSSDEYEDRYERRSGGGRRGRDDYY